MDTESIASYVETYVQEHMTQYKEELREFCSIDSDSYNKAGLDEMANLLAARLRGIGVDVHIIEHEDYGNSVLGLLHGEGESTIAISGHLDTVYPVGTAATRPVQIENDVAYGPGVSDMKGCVLSAIYAIEALKAQGYQSFRELRFVCVSDEEIGTPQNARLLEQTFQGCQYVLVLEAASEDGNIVSARKGVATYTLLARGKEAHVGTSSKEGRNAVVELAHQISQFYRLDGWREGVTVNPAIISGGTATNVVPAYAEAKFNMRFLDPEDEIATMAQWYQMMKQRVVPDVELELECIHKRDPMISTPEGIALARRAQQLAATLGFSLDHELRGGGSDASFASKCGIPALDGLGPIGGADHSPAEYLRLSSVAPRAALLAGLIASIEEGIHICKDSELLATGVL